MKPFAATTRFLIAALVVLSAVALPTGDARAFRLVQPLPLPGTYTAGAAVTCSDFLGFAHWDRRSTTWRLNTGNQGSGKSTALTNALNSWTNVTPAGYELTLGSTTTAGINGTDNRNVFRWATDSRCSGNCLALTFLTVGFGFGITDVDILFDNTDSWSTSPGTGQFDVQSVAAHEIGHGMGIHHTQVTTTPRPTMFASISSGTTDRRSLEADDRAALNCVFDRYTPSSRTLEDEPNTDSDRDGSDPHDLAAAPGGAAGTPAMALAISARPAKSGGVLVRFTLPAADQVKIQLYDVAGRLASTLVDEHHAAGDHEIILGATQTQGLGSGVYFIRMTTSHGQARSKAMVVR